MKNAMKKVDKGGKAAKVIPVRRATDGVPADVRTTIVIPGDLVDYFNARVKDPRNNGNASCYLRNLVIDERERAAQANAA